MRTFIVKRTAGPALVVAHRIEDIRQWLHDQGYGDQFHPSYTRMVPAHHITEVRLVGCPDPSPVHTRFLTPQRDRLPADIDAIGGAYIGALHTALTAWIKTLPAAAPLGVLFSGGIDSGSVLLTLHQALLDLGESPARLKAFTLAAGGDDLDQARDFLKRTGMEVFLEPILAAPDDLDLAEAVRITEDYKPLDVQSAAMAIALLKGIRSAYPDWRYLVDGDGGDENLKDYPIEDNPELTIVSVLSNPLLYQEGWGVHSVKHSQTYSGGLSRGAVRGFAPARAHGFVGFSPYMLPALVDMAEGIPFIELTDWSHEALYALKGQVVAAGVRHVTGVQMPVFDKRRFQHGAAERGTVAKRLPDADGPYRRAFAETFGP
jgi:asparagine synthase (glutamine-hydrolysing)